MPSMRVNQILSSIAMEELGMSHILNAEGEKLQYILGTLPGLSGPAATRAGGAGGTRGTRGAIHAWGISSGRPRWTGAKVKP